MSGPSPLARRPHRAQHRLLLHQIHGFGLTAEGSDLQHHGQQTVDELNYMESRAEKAAFIFIHKEQPKTHEPGEQQPLEENFELEVIRIDMDCERPKQVSHPEEPPAWWRMAVKAASTHAN